MTKLYELTYIANPDYNSEEITEVFKKITNFIIEKNGSIEQEKDPVKIKLSYPIKKKSEAFLITIIFNLSPDNIKELEKELKAENQILRYLIIKLKREKAKKEKVSIPKIIKTETPSKTTEKAQKPIKAEINEIDKKIEEILNE
jgi:small subunit ribosomal protein S6